MSDYLGHLLERSFASTPAVRPQIPSLFEPKPAAEQALLRLDSSETNPEASAGILVTPGKEKNPVRSPGNFPEQTTDEIAPVKQELRPVEVATAGNPKPDHFVAEAKSAVEIAPLTKPALRLEDSVSTHNDQSPRKAIGRPAPIEVPRVANHPEPIAADSKPQLSENQSKVVVDLNLADSERRHRDQRPPEAPQNLQPRTAPVVPREIRPARPAKSSATASLTVAPSSNKIGGEGNRAPETASMPPQIHVTIGRVEIRAHTTAPTATRSAPRKESGLSLENYLQRRAGGGPS